MGGGEEVRNLIQIISYQITILEMIETVQPIRIILPDHPDHFADLHEVTFQTSFLRRVRYSTTKCGPNNWWEYTLYDSYQVGYQKPFLLITFFP